MAKRAVIDFGIYTSGGVEKTTWKVIDVDLGSEGRYSEVAVQAPAALLEEWDTEFNPDERLFVKRDTTVVFKGRGLNPVLRWGGDFEEVAATFYGPEWDLDRYHIIGQYADDVDGNPQIFTGLKCVFNEMGEMNKVVGSLEFEPDLSKTSGREYWTIEDMIQYLVTRFDAEGESGLVDTAIPSWPTNAGTDVFFHVSCHGMTYLAGLRTVCERAGYHWSLRPKDDLTNEHELILTKRGAVEGTTKTVYVPPQGTALNSISEANRLIAAQSGNVNLDHVSVVTELTGMGGVKVYESTYTLRRGWTAAEEASVFAGSTTVKKVGNFERLKSRDKSAYYDRVGRRYVLNETGREETTPVSVAWDFSPLFGEPHTARPRPFLAWRPTKDAEGHPMMPVVYVDGAVYGGGSGTVEGEYTWELLSEIAGILFVSDVVPYDRAKALQDDDYTAGFPDSVVIRAAVFADQAITHTAPPSSPDLITAVERVIDLESKFSWDNVHGVTQGFEDYIDLRAAAVAKRQDVGRFMLQEIADGFALGDWLNSIGGRTITLHGQIVGIRWDVDRQTTELFTETMLADAWAEGLQGSAKGRGAVTPAAEMTAPPTGARGMTRGYWADLIDERGRSGQ